METKTRTTYNYIEIRRASDDAPVKRLDVTGKSEQSRDRIEVGMNINLNHADYYTYSFDSSEKLETL